MPIRGNLIPLNSVIRAISSAMIQVDYEMVMLLIPQFLEGIDG